MNNNFWLRGERAALARMAGISPPMLSDILHRRRGVSAARAQMLADLCNELYGYDAIPFSAWLFNKETSHPAFFD